MTHLLLNYLLGVRTWDIRVGLLLCSRRVVLAKDLQDTPVWKSDSFDNRFYCFNYFCQGIMAKTYCKPEMDVLTKGYSQPKIHTKVLLLQFSFTNKSFIAYLYMEVCTLLVIYSFNHCRNFYHTNNLFHLLDFNKNFQRFFNSGIL